MCLLGCCMLRKTLSSLSDDGWGSVAILLFFFRLKASQNQNLQAVGWGQVLERKWKPLRGFMQLSVSQNHHHLCPRLHNKVWPVSARGTLILIDKSGSVSYKVITFFSRVLVHTKSCVEPPRMEFFFPSVLWNYCGQTPLTFKDRLSAGSYFLCLTPKFVNLTCG